jgi:aldose 1-epimerase
MDVITIANERETLRAGFMPSAGASIVSFEGRMAARWLPLMRPTPPEAIAAGNVGRMASFNLVPWSNRVVGAAFDFQGKHYTLRANTPQGFAIHGDVRERPWQVSAQRSDTLTCTLDSRDFVDMNFPFPFSARIDYALGNDTFDTTLTLTNIGATAMPAGFGFHPYFNRGFGATDSDEVELQFHGAGIYPPLPGMTTRPIPASQQLAQPDSGMRDVPADMDFSTQTRLSTRDIDHCYGGWDGRASIVYPAAQARLDFECDPIFSHVILYSPPGKPFLALEPVTHANDGFNLIARGRPGSGIRVLQPGAALSGRFRIRLVNGVIP